MITRQGTSYRDGRPNLPFRVDGTIEPWSNMAEVDVRREDGHPDLLIEHRARCGFSESVSMGLSLVDCNDNAQRAAEMAARGHA